MTHAVLCIVAMSSNDTKAPRSSCGAEDQDPCRWGYSNITAVCYSATEPQVPT